MQRLLIVLLILIIICFTAYAFSRNSYYSSNHPMLKIVRTNFAKLNPEYADIPLQEGDSAYTENKSVITLCLQDPDTGIYYDINTIMYVALHELSHMISKSHGHNDEFKKNFSDILKKASRIGIYNPDLPIPSTYCKINSSYN
jgi:hypothetical protein